MDSIECRPAVPVVATPAPYGKACRSCAKAKCRCLIRPGGEKSCERCRRLKRECIPSVSVRVRGAKGAPTSRTGEDATSNSGRSYGPPTLAITRADRGHGIDEPALIEEKLDGLVALLKDQVAPALASAKAAPDVLNTPSPSTPSVGPERTPTNSTNTYEPVDDRHAELDVPQPGLPDYVPSVPACSVEITPLEAEKNLALFREQILFYLPFIYLPPSMTARQLREEKPFLWFNIMAITSQSLRKQSMMSSAIRVHVAEKMVVQHQKSTDLLLGLLVFLAWSHLHRKERSHFMLMSSLTMSLVYDLAMYKHPAEMPNYFCTKYGKDTTTRSAAGTTTAKERTAEARRATLACFYLTSSFSCNVGRLEPLHGAALLDEDLQALGQQPECKEDIVLVSLVKIQLLLDHIVRAPWQPQGSGPPAFYVDALHARLQAIKREIPDDLLGHAMLQAALLHAELVIHEATHLRAPLPLHRPDYWRHAQLQDTLRTLGDWFDAFFALPLARHVAMPFFHWGQLGHCLTALLRLAWNTPAATTAATATPGSSNTSSIMRGNHQQSSSSSSSGATGLPELVGAVTARLAALHDAVTAHWRRAEGGDADSALLRVRRILETLRVRWEAEVGAVSHQAPPGAVTAGGESLGVAAGSSSSGGGGGVGPGAVIPGPRVAEEEQAMLSQELMYRADEAWLADILQMPWE